MASLREISLESFFITGTDTGVGKTFVTCALLRKAARQGFTAIGMKPVAAGGQGDVDQLIAASNICAPHELINPYGFSAVVSPHLAAASTGRAIHIPTLCEAYRQLTALAQIVLVEGVGGFLVPLSNDSDTGDMAVALNLPVILVVGLRLGCLNHALLTCEAIRARGLTLAGWIANPVDPAMNNREENIQTLKARITAPQLMHPAVEYPPLSKEITSCQTSCLASPI